MPRSLPFLFLLLLIGSSVLAQTLYLIPGTGADHRLFNKIDLESHRIVHIDYVEPIEKESFEHYISRLAEQIDTTESFSLLGVSLGGMIVTELAEQLQPEAAIVIAGAKHRKELPITYRVFRYLPIHHLVGGRTMKWSTKQLQPLFEPMDEEAETLFEEMLTAKSNRFLRSAVRWMIAWEREIYTANIVHIHGTKDHTLPAKYIEADYFIEGGGHMVVYTHADDINQLLQTILNP